jgi:hypothetical protein
LKQRATNGSRAKLSVDQLLFVGFDPELELEEQDEPVTRRAWLQPINPSNIDQRLTELAEARDIAPGWYALARRILEDEKVNRK